MAWSKEDRAFKILSNRRSTSTDKTVYEEQGATTLEVKLSSVFTDTIPVNPGVEDPQERIAKKYTLLALTRDQSVADSQAWVAMDGSNVLTDWLDVNSGAAYGIKLYDGNGVLIGITDPSKWIFDFPTGVLTFNGNVGGFVKPFKISGYRYVGLKGKDGLVNIDDASTSSPRNTYSIDKILRSSPAKFMVIRGDGGRALFDAFNDCFTTLQAGDRVSINTNITNTLYLKSNMVINLNGFSSTPAQYLDGISDDGGFNGTPVVNAMITGNPTLNITGTGTWGIGTFKASSLTYYGDINAPNSSAITAWKGGTLRCYGSYNGGVPAVGNTMPTDPTACVNALETGSKAYVQGKVFGNSVGVRAKSGGYAEVRGEITANFAGVLVEGTNYTTASAARVQGVVDMRGSTQPNADAIIMFPGSTLTLVNATLFAKGSGKAIRGTGTVYVQGSLEHSGAIDSTITIIRVTNNYDIIPVDDTAYNYAEWLPVTKGTSKRTLALKFGSVDRLIDLLSPDKPALMGTLTVSNITQYTARLAAGLDGTKWYSGLIPAGSAVSVSYKAASTFPFTLSFAGFRAGSIDTPDSYGELTGTITDITGGVSSTTHNMRLSPYNGTTGFLTVSNIRGHENFWSKADGTMTFGEPADGYRKYEMQHSEAGKSPAFINFYDDNVTLPSFTLNPTYAVATPVYKYLSGIQLYGAGSTFNLSYTVANAFNKTYISSGVTQINAPGMNTVDVDFTGIPNYDSSLAVVNKVLTLGVANQFSDAPNVNVRVRKPYNLNVVNRNVALDKGVNTYGVVSSSTEEFFHDEDKRQYSSNFAPFVSNAVLPAGEAVVYNGKLSYGTTYYPGKTGLQYFVRDFALSVSPSGAIVFNGIGYGDIAAYGTGSLNVLLYLPTQQLYYDLGKPIGINNGSGNGSSPANSMGCLNTVSDKIYFTFGTNNTVNNQNIYKMIVIFRSDAGKVITKITTSKQ